MSIVHSYRDIARIANLRALDGRPQSEDKPVEMPCDVNPDPEGWGMFAGYGRGYDTLAEAPPAPAWFERIYTAPESDVA